MKVVKVVVAVGNVEDVDPKDQGHVLLPKWTDFKDPLFQNPNANHFAARSSGVMKSVALITFF